MNINILDKFYDKIAIVDDYTSLMWCVRYYDVGALDLEIEATVENIDLFKKNNFITRDDDETIYRIEKIELETDSEGNDKLIIGAVDCKIVLSQRITWEQVFLNNSDVQQFISEMINQNFINTTNERKLNLEFDTDDVLNGIGQATTRQSTYDDIGQKIIELCKTYELGWKVIFNGENFIVKLYKGVDRSVNQMEIPQVVFSPDNDNLFSSKYNFDMSEYKNVALVGGEGKGLDRKLRSVGVAYGIERRETFVDAGNANEGDDLADYYAALEEEGKNTLSELTAKTSFEAEIDTSSLNYKTDYNLGDIITIKNKYGIKSNARIVEIIETWDDSGYTIEPVFEYVEEVINVNKALFTEYVELIFTESSEYLLYEFSPFITENSENIILSEDGKNITVEGFLKYD